ncbi:MAG: YbaB/EbfC family nucleoid-associated protein [Dehalococcoidaceae bacterium]|nr:YbaB/EbfC family nucleoid-associated protein [Dehalococcoidaceae bacterium]
MNLSMMKQAMELKSKMQKVQKELEKARIEGQAGDGLVKVTVNGQQKVLSVKISPEAMDPAQPGKLEKLVFKAVTDALDQSKKIANERLGELTGGFKIPGLTE